MNLRSAFVTNTQATKLMQPCDGAFNDPTGLAQAAAVFGVTSGDLAFDTPFSQSSTMRLAVIAAVGLHQLRFAQRSAGLARDGWNFRQQRQQLCAVVTVGFGENNAQRNALRVAKDVMFRARLTAIGWVRSSFFPPCTARIEELSATAREKSILSAPRRRASSTACKRSQTPAFCHACSRRQQLMPEPQPICWGSICQGMPDLSTNKMPPSTFRSSSGFRPGWRLRRRFGLGSNGCTVNHRSSSTSSRAILPHTNSKMQRIVPVKCSFC